MIKVFPDTRNSKMCYQKFYCKTFLEKTGNNKNFRYFSLIKKRFENVPRNVSNVRSDYCCILLTRVIFIRQSKYMLALIKQYKILVQISDS